MPAGAVALWNAQLPGKMEQLAPMDCFNDTAFAPAADLLVICCLHRQHRFDSLGLPHPTFQRLLFPSEQAVGKSKGRVGAYLHTGGGGLFESSVMFCR